MQWVRDTDTDTDTDLNRQLQETIHAMCTYTGERAQRMRDDVTHPVLHTVFSMITRQLQETERA
jgi:hypothetical protein